MSDAIDDDTLQAVQAAWKTDKVKLPALIPVAPQAGRLKAPQTMPYVQAACELDRRELAGTAGVWHDHRRVTLRCYGVKADVTAALKAMGDVFNLRTVLTYPAKDANGLPLFRRWLPQDGGGLIEDPDVKAGQDVWVGELVGLVWSVRSN